LSHQGENLFSPTAASGEPIAGLPGGGSFGDLVFGALEGSNTELASEVVSQIVSSASVKANIAALKTQDEVLGTVIDLQAR
jgi:flagellar hook protein FlgE